MKIEVSNGEIIDKLTILKIKEAKITSSQKLSNVKNELELLEPLAEQIGMTEESEVYRDLLLVNAQLWEVEDNIRKKENLKEFDEEFISLARSAYMLNDERCVIKKKINTVTKSFLIEEKNHDLS